MCLVTDVSQTSYTKPVVVVVGVQSYTRSDWCWAVLLKEYWENITVSLTNSDVVLPMSTKYFLLHNKNIISLSSFPLVHIHTWECTCVWCAPLVLCFKTSLFTAQICGQRGFPPCYWANVLSSHPSRLQYSHYHFLSRNESLLNPAVFYQVKATQLAEISWHPDLGPTLAFSSVLYEYVLKTHKLNKKTPAPKAYWSYHIDSLFHVDQSKQIQRLNFLWACIL